VRGCALLRRRARGGSSFAALLVPAGCTPDDAVVCDALVAPAVSPATDDQVNAATGFAAGLVSPIGPAPDVEVLVDAALTRHDVVYCALGRERGGPRHPDADLLVASGAGRSR
jgi:prolyl-tRNA editing enzyme YbaK/EbsC (Cys-tRNA(Pro) deacylase)